MRVLVGHDHALFRDGIVSPPEAAGFDVVGQVGDGQAAVEPALRLHPDLVLLDIRMPGMSGLEALGLIKKERPDTQVVMPTASDHAADFSEAIESGATGYLRKNLTADASFEMLDSLQRGEAAMSRQATARLMKGFADRSRQRPEPVASLSQREVEILRLVAQGLSSKAVAENRSVSENTVKYHMKNILQKLGAHNRTEAVAHAICAGLLNPDSPS
jgi:DNA-binding NarL/FixJ family response regulator